MIFNAFFFSSQMHLKLIFLKDSKHYKWRWSSSALFNGLYGFYVLRLLHWIFFRFLLFKCWTNDICKSCVCIAVAIWLHWLKI